MWPSVSLPTGTASRHGTTDFLVDWLIEKLVLDVC